MKLPGGGVMYEIMIIISYVEVPLLVVLCVELLSLFRMLFSGLI